MAKGVNFTFKATNAAKPAMRDFQRGLEGIQTQTKRTQVLQRSWNRGLNANRRAVQQFGFQMSDFAIQISGGQSAMLAFIQQGGQMLQFFGATGAIAAAVLAVFGSLALAFTRSGHTLSELTPLMGVLREEFQGLARVMGVVKEFMIDVTNVVVNNLDTILIAASLVAGFFAAKWVSAFTVALITTGAFSNVLRATVLSFYAAGAGAAAATLATSAWSGALALLRVALLRLGLPALIIAAAYLIERFMALSKAAGGFSAAASLLGDVVKEVFQRIADRVQWVQLSFKIMMNNVQYEWVAWLSRLHTSFAEFVNGIAGTGLGETLGLNTVDVESIMKGYTKTANELTDSLEIMLGQQTALEEGFKKPLTSLQKIRDLIKESKVDVRDWFGNGDSGSGGGKSPSERAKSEADRTKEIFERTQQAIASSMKSAFKGLLDGSKSFGDAARDILGSILDQVFDILMTPIFNNIAGNIAGSLMGGLSGIMSFDGGGFTGAGVRAGGMDGKGGKLAMVHPNEDVVDRTKGQSTGGNTVVFNVSTPDAESFKRSQRQLSRQMKAALG